MCAASPGSAEDEPTDEEYRRLARFRRSLRRYLWWAEQRAIEAGVTPAQHQLMLAVRAWGDGVAPTVGELADELLLRHNSTVGLVDRAEAAGLVCRMSDDSDHRVVRVRLTPRGRRVLGTLAGQHLVELSRLDAELGGVAERLGDRFVDAWRS
jgi:DNA-binding MarR family transcriptional regulator